MRIGLTNPTTWPWVCRGGERFLNELAAWLGARGHEVTVLSGKPGRTQIVRGRGYTAVCRRRLWHPSLAKIGLLEFHAFFPVLLSELLRRRFDAILCCTFLDTYAAMLARSITGTPCVFWVNSPPPPVQYFRSLTLGGTFVRRAMAGADEIIALSGYMQQLLQARYGRGGIVLPLPVDLERFPLRRGRDLDRPIIVCAAALEDRRKGGDLLMRAFDLLKLRLPRARLEIAPRVDASTRDRLLALVSPQWRADVEFYGRNGMPGPGYDLDQAYARAAASVLPSRWEAFGAVVIESMASGTPVAGTRDGALPELINSPAVGRLFDTGEDAVVEPTNVEGLARAMEECIELSRDPATPARCRERAAEVSWDAAGPKFEALFERLARPRRAAVAVRSSAS